jgi:hypothetical protein
MADKGAKFDGGLVETAVDKTKGVSSHYRNFIGFEHAISSKILVVQVMGEVLVGNPGIKAVLRYAEPQGINPKIILLRLDLIQRPGVWPQIMTWVSAKYVGALMKTGLYSDAQIINAQLGGLTVKIVPI